MNPKRLALAAYTCSGIAGLVYQATWTRLLTLYMGHSIAAASTVVAAFMGGLAGGAALGGWIVPHLSPRQALYGYIGVEAVVAFAALVLPIELIAVRPLLAWAYQDGAAGALFPAVRLLTCFFLVLIPAMALGATFPAVVHWFVRTTDHPGRGSGVLYAANTVGATFGALLAGFMLIPTIGISGTTLVGVAASGLSIACVLAVLTQAEPSEARPDPRRGRRAPSKRTEEDVLPQPWLAASVLALTGIATFVYEIAWVRVLSLVIGPTTYAFAATLAVLIGGMACGAALGAWVAGRAARPGLWLALTLAGTAAGTSWATSFVGSDLPRLVAQQLVQAPYLHGQLLSRHGALVAALILPTAFGVGVAFPLALEMVGGRGPLARRIGWVYAVNTIAGLAGALGTGFVAIPVLGLQPTLQLASGALIAAALVVLVRSRLTSAGRVLGLLTATAALMMTIQGPPWDRELLASGVYKYAARAPEDLDIATTLKAGTLLYYRDGAASTVSVRELAGTRALSVDGKVDASTGADMLTQKVLAHLPLLLHPNPRDVLVVGLGSGVTAGSALVHPIARLDVVEISPEVVEASQYFAPDNGNALADPRTRLIVGDGRSHLLLSKRKYDVIVSEPSNPWMAGVAALFTQEFFRAAREGLAPGGIMCQWAHTYDISDADLRSIAATFVSVFPHGTMWLVGEGDVLLVASTTAIDARLNAVEDGWRRSGVAHDLSKVSAVEPFDLLSLFVAGSDELRRYGAGAALQTDDRMALEFSGPLALYAPTPADNAATLRGLFKPGAGPAAIRQALDAAGAAQWRNRGAMQLSAEDYGSAYRDYMTALTLNPIDVATLDGAVRAAIASDREAELLDRLKSSMSRYPQQPAIRVAMSKLLATMGTIDEAITVATEAVNVGRGDARALEQLASIYADIGDAERLKEVVATLRQVQPGAATTSYYAAEAGLIEGRFDEAIRFAREAADRDPNNAAAYNLAGAGYANLGQRDAARQAFETALRLDPRDAAVHVNLGRVELESGNPSAAARHFAEALALDPQSAAARRGLAEAR